MPATPRSSFTPRPPDRRWLAAALLLLLQIGCSGDNRTELMAAASLGDVEGMNRIMARGGDVNTTSNHGKTALLLAAGNGHLMATHILIARGAQVNAQDRNGTTPLLAAATNDKPDCVQVLLANGADPTITDVSGNSPLRNAVFFRLQGVLEILLKFKDKFHPDERAEAMLMAASLGYNEILTQMLEQGFNVNIVGFQGRTPIMAAVEFDHPRTVKLLLDRGADISIADVESNTPLEIAQNNGNDEIAALLTQQNIAKPAAAAPRDPPASIKKK